MWNTIPVEIRNVINEKTFIKKVKEIMIANY